MMLRSSIGIRGVVVVVLAFIRTDGVAAKTSGLDELQKVIQPYWNQNVRM